MSILVPLAVWFPLSSMHMPGICDDTGPAGNVQAWFLKPLHEPSITRVPLAVLKPVSDRHIPDAGLRRVIGIAPSDALRHRLHDDTDKWKTFIAEYSKELKQPEAQEAAAQLRKQLRKGPVTLLYAARDEEHNNAVALKYLLERRG